MRILHETLESFRIAMEAIRANKARGILTTLGIIIGVVGVITTMTAANGISSSFKESVSALGSDVLYVSRMPWVMRGNWFEFRNRPNLSLKEVEKLEGRLQTALAVNPTVSTQKSIKYRSDSLRGIDVIGTTEQHMIVSSSVPEFGRFLTSFDVDYRKYVCVIGSEVRERLFADVDALNKNLRIGRYDFRIVGIMEKQGSAGFFGGPDFDSQVFVPVTTFVRAYGASSNREFNIAVKAPPGTSLEDFEFEVIGEMRKVRKLAPGDAENFTINKMDALVGMFNNVMGVVVLIGMIITGISLFVGGIGVMNIMFVSVTERTREIGIRKAIGAKRRAILAQFLFESSTICLLGGVVGLLVAYGVTHLIDKMFLPAKISPGIAILALVVSVSVGVLSGIIPAFKASRLHPIDALHYE